MKKIIFVNAVYFSYDDSPHIGQFILRDILKDEYEVLCLNFDYLNKVGDIHYLERFEDNIKLMGNYILAQAPDAVGFYTICNAFITAVKLAEYVKRKNPLVAIFLGGPQATLVYKKCLEAFDFIDAICLGESELTIKMFMHQLLGNKNFTELPGVAYRSDGKVLKNICSPLISQEDLNKYIVSDYSPFQLTKKDRMSIEGGRGCPYACTFCTTSSFWGRVYRIKSIDVLIEEMKAFYTGYGIYQFAIQHDMFTANRKYIYKFCEKLINENTPFEWACSSRIDVLDYGLIDIMNKAKCVAIYFGIETGSIRMQKNINKNLNLEQVIDIVKYIKERTKIEMTLSFIYCYPDEKIKDFKCTIKLIEQLFLLGVSLIQLHRFIPLPCTVETEKIKDKMYFDKMRFDEIDKMILRYPDMFSQYYTFDSEVSKRYRRFDYLIEIINSMSEFYFSCFRFLIKKYGLEVLYFRMENILEQIFQEYQSRTVEQRMMQDILVKLPWINDAISPFLEEEAFLDQTELLKELYRYERKKVLYFMSDKEKIFYMYFPFNMEIAIKEQIAVREDYYIKYSKEKGKVYTRHVILSAKYK